VGLKSAQISGVLAALNHYKLANSMGAEHGVMPSGPEVSHGTDRIQYAKKNDGSPVDNTQGVTDHGNPSWQRDLMPGWLFDNFTAYDGDLGPGLANGQFGEETIG
jgi:hypothetical protein